LVTDSSSELAGGGWDFPECVALQARLKLVCGQTMLAENVLAENVLAENVLAENVLAENALVLDALAHGWQAQRERSEAKASGTHACTAGARWSEWRSGLGKGHSSRVRAADCQSVCVPEHAAPTAR
jgi:hypothetical protein